MSDVQLLGPASSISFDKTPGELCKVRTMLASWWKQFSIDKSSLFNGPVAACSECELSSSGAIRIAWYETDYAHYLQRVAVSPIATPARAIFCSVALRAASGDLLVGWMAGNTSSPGRLQLPGGNVTIGRTGLLSADSCAEDACREFQEEVGIVLQPTQLNLWRVKVGGRFDDVGLIYVCDPGMSEREIQDVFDLHARAERQAGISSEFEELLFVGADFFAGATEREWVDYLPIVANQLAHHWHG
jgi:8-oxo-dGTP pyrophosphatase MutT (NUDIX family)